MKQFKDDIKLYNKLYNDDSFTHLFIFIYNFLFIIIMKQYDYRNPLDIQEALMAAENKRKLITETKIDTRDKKIRLLFFEFEKYMNVTTYDVDDVDIIFIASDSCKYELKNNVLTINDYNNKLIKVDLTNDINNTIIYAKAGYTLNKMTFLLNKFVEAGFIVINDPRKIITSSDKYLTALLLDEYSINQPKYTIVTNDDCNTDDPKKDFEKILKPIYGNVNEDNKYVCKLLNGHGGNGVFICKGKNILSIIQCIFSIDDSQKILIQQALDIKDGDIRAYVLTYNGKQELVTCITRKKANNDFRTNISLGSTFEKFELTNEQKQFAFNVAEKTGLMFCGVDMCIDEKTNKLYVIEINGAPGAPVPIGLSEEENHHQHAEYYQMFTNKLMSIIK